MISLPSVMGVRSLTNLTELSAQEKVYIVKSYMCTKVHENKIMKIDLILQYENCSLSLRQNNKPFFHILFRNTITEQIIWMRNYYNKQISVANIRD